MKKQTHSADETREFGKKFAEQVAAGNVLLLFGNLGGGKTTFLQGFAKGLGIEKRIISPTFIIVRKYDMRKNNMTTFYHIDLYRTQTEEDLIGLGLPEILIDKNAVVAIEWPEKLGKLLPQKRWEFYFETLSENTRSITIEKHE